MAGDHRNFLDEAVTAHGKWKVRLRNFAFGGDAINPDDASKDCLCALGKWIYGEGAQLSQKEGFSDLKAEHANFHRCAGHIAHLIAAGDKNTAHTLLDDGNSDFNQASKKTIGAIKHFKETLCRTTKGLANKSIRAKLLMLLAIPAAALVIFAGIILKADLEEWHGYSSLARIMEVSVNIGDVVHHLQSERGLSSGFIGSHGERFRNELNQARSESDKEIATLHAVYAEAKADLPDNVRQRLEEALKPLDDLASHREKIDQQAFTTAAATAPYSKIISQILDTIPLIAAQSANARIAVGVTAYDLLILGKEQAGRERALMTAVLSAGKFEPEQRRAWGELLAKQQAYFRQFETFAAPDVRKFYRKTLDDPAFAAVEAMRKAADSNGQEAMPDAGGWFKSATARINLLHDSENFAAARIKEQSGHLIVKARNALLVEGVLALAVIVLTTVIGLWIMNNIHNVLGHLSKAIHTVEQSGDLSIRINVSSNDEVGLAAKAFNDLMDSFQAVLNDIAYASRLVEASASQMSGTLEELDASANTQSEATSAMAAAIEQMTVSIGMVANNASETEALSTTTREASDAGEQVVHHAVDEMELIASSVDRTAAQIQSLAEQSGKISGIVGVIKEIAEQTNLLALNAAIEAARAGEQGRGFAVVADEVRKLAERTTQATAEIGGLIETMQQETQTAVTSMERSKDEADKGHTLAQEVGASLSTISGNVRHTAGRIAEIASAAREQSSATQDIAVNVEHISQMVEKNHGAVRQITDASVELKRLADSMGQAVGNFKV